MEVIVLLLVAFSAWPFGSVHQGFQWVLYIGVGMVLALWAARAVLDGRVHWVPCRLVLALAAMCLLGMVQVLPLDAAWVRCLSPETGNLQAFAMPTPQELDDAGVGSADSGKRTLSFDAGATRGSLLQLLAALALFAAVRNNLRAPGTFYRLAWVCAANGVLLALVGMAQMASSPPNVVLWSYPTDGSVFGPFICRNHFAYYANLCIGMTAGLLLGTRYFLTAAQRDAGASRDPVSAWRGMLRDPRVLWLATLLALLFAGLLASLSRGGLFGLIAGGTAAVLLMLARGTMPRWAICAGMLLVAGLLIGWLGLDRVTQRWNHMLSDATAQGRLDVWLCTLPLVERFPIFGTGLGTYAVVEPPTRSPGDPPNIVWDHAHNDFLELWIEGGTPALLVALVATALALWQGIRAFQRYPNNALGRLALGGLIGLIAVIVQSFVDFGLHVPAVAVLTAVVAAMLANLAEALEPCAEAPAEAALAPSSRRQRLAALVQAVAVLVVAFFLVSEGRRSWQAERACQSAWRTLGERQIALLRAAVALAPARVEYRLRLTDSLVRHADATALRSEVMTLFAAGPVASWHAHVAAAGLGRWVGAIAQDGREIREARVQAVLAQLHSPLATDAHERVLKLTARAGGDPTLALERLARLNPSEPSTWCALGLLNLKRGQRADACRCLRNALIANDRLLQPIAKVIPDALTPDEFLDHVLPPYPPLILAAVDMLSSQPLSDAYRKRYLRAALALLEDRGDARNGEDWLLEARVYTRLDETGAARDAYLQALARSPRSVPWRFEFGDFLQRIGRNVEARRELALVLEQDPGNQAARGLFQRVDRMVAERE
jgi:O-antigen ligase/tetratricopeptide (TPR) repeat protein